jgi:2-octaprenyl-6-methoxyphenol hydroxylase
MTSPPQFDLLVIGGGLTGQALACAAAGEGLRVLMVERASLAATVAPPFDGRVTAIAPGSRRLLEAIGVWPALAADAQPILDIEVGEPDSPLGVHYDHRQVGDEPLGHIVENRLIRMALLARAEALAGSTLVMAAPDQVARLDRRGAAVSVRLESGMSAQAALCVVAEGRQSLTRAEAGIWVMRWDYDQTGMVATIAHALPHDGVATERFYASGPFAILPMTGRRSSIVWAADNSLARDLIGLDDGQFLDELAERFGGRLGAL